MFSNKIILLVAFAILSISQPVFASDSGTQLLIDRAHYWSKLGRVDMAHEVWQAVLRADPANTEALAEEAQYKKQHEASMTSESNAIQSGIGPGVENKTVEPVAAKPPEAAPVAVPAPEVAATSEAVPQQAAAPEVQVPAVISAPEAAVVPDAAPAPLPAETAAAVNEAVPAAESVAPVAAAAPEVAATSEAVPLQAAAPEVQVPAPEVISAPEAAVVSDAAPAPLPAVTAAPVNEAVPAAESVAPVAAAAPEVAATSEAVPLQAAAPEAPVPAPEVISAPEAAVVPDAAPATLPAETAAAVNEAVPAAESVAPVAAAVPEVAATSEAIPLQAAAPEVQVPAPEVISAPEAAVVPDAAPAPLPAVASAPVHDTVPASEAIATHEVALVPEAAPLVAPAQAPAPEVVAPPEIAPLLTAVTTPDFKVATVPEVAAAQTPVYDVNHVSESAAVTQQSSAYKPKAVQVEDWADLYSVGGEVNSEPVGSDASIESGAQQTTDDRAIHSLLAEPSVSVAIESPSPANPAQAVAEQPVTALPAAGNVPAVPEAVKSQSAAVPETVRAPEVEPAPVEARVPETPVVQIPAASGVLSAQPKPETATVQLSPAPDKSSAGVQSRPVQVEDWADLYGGGAPPDDSKTETGPNAQQNSDDNAQQRERAKLPSEEGLVSERNTHPVLAEPSVSVGTENHVADKSINPAQAVAEQPVTAMAATGNVLAAPAPAPALVSVPAPVHVLSETREKAGTSEKLPDHVASGLQLVSSADESQVIPGSAQSEASAGPGGSILVNKQPTKQELLDRAAYWESRGRSDLAAKARDQTREVASVAVSGIRSLNTDSHPDALPVNRPALTGQQVEREPFSSGRVAPTRVADVPLDTDYATRVAAKPSRQDMNEKAQYWEARGRGDLAVQIRQKLQTMEGSQGSISTERAGRDVGGRGEKIPEDTARSALEDSLLRNPNSLKTRLDLAQIYRAAGEIAKARVQVDSVLINNPDLPDALFASAQLYAEQRLWWETLNTLEKISPVARTAEMARLQKTGWAHMQIDRADALVRQGKNQEAELLLREVAVELAVSYNQTALPEPPPLWKSAGTNAGKSEKIMKKKSRR